MVNPCKDCPARHAACHDTCERYKAYKAELDAQRSYTYQMTHHQGVYHEDHIDRKRNARRYIRGQKWEQIAVEMRMDFRWITRRHHIAVDGLTLESPIPNP